MAVFQPNVFQHNVFQGPFAGAAASAGLTGHWRGPAKGRKGGIEGRIRLLSELDEKPLFTPEEILDGGPQQINVDADMLKAMAMDAVGELNAKIGRDLAELKRKKLIAAIADDEDNFMVM